MVEAAQRKWYLAVHGGPVILTLWPQDTNMQHDKRTPIARHVGSANRYTQLQENGAHLRETQKRPPQK